MCLRYFPLQVTGYIQDTRYSPLAVCGGGISPVIAATQTPVLPTVSPYPHVTTVATQTSGDDMRLPKYETVPAVNTSAATGITALPQHASYLPLSPRERKIVEFRESYSPSFLQGRPLCLGGLGMVSVLLTVLGQGEGKQGTCLGHTCKVVYFLCVLCMKCMK
jgi:hypothetical protein